MNAMELLQQALAGPTPQANPQGMRAEIYKEWVNSLRGETHRRTSPVHYLMCVYDHYDDDKIKFNAFGMLADIVIEHNDNCKWTDDGNWEGFRLRGPYCGKSWCGSWMLYDPMLRLSGLPAGVANLLKSMYFKENCSNTDLVMWMEKNRHYVLNPVERAKLG